jgi:LacI family transcriptional regulator
VAGLLRRLERLSTRRRPTVTWARDWTAEAGRAAAPGVLARRPDGVFCGNDRLAQGLLEACRESDQLPPLVVGFDNAPISQTLDLTTVAIPWRSIARAVRRTAELRLLRSGQDLEPAIRLSMVPQPVIRSQGMARPTA